MNTTQKRGRSGCKLLTACSLLVTLTKDTLLHISSFLSIMQIRSLRRVCKQFHAWLSDPTSFSWKKRIELAFPLSAQLLGEDVNIQMARLCKFDTLIEEGHQVSFFDLSALGVCSFNEDTFKQIPWNRTQFILTRSTAIYLFDSLSGRATEQFKFDETISSVLFDIQNQKVGLVTDGILTLFQYRENKLLPTKSQVYNFRRHVLGQIYGEYVVSWDEYLTLTWYSLATDAVVKQIHMEETSRSEMVLSTVEPVIYLAESVQYRYVYRIWRIDGTLRSEETKTLLYERSFDAEVENCCDGVDGLSIVENESGRILQVPQLGTGDCSFSAYDLERGRMIATLLFNASVCVKYRMMQFNPAAPHCCLEADGTLVIRDVKADYASKKQNQDDGDSSVKCESNKEMMIDYGRKDPTDYACYSRVFDYGLHHPNNWQWLNDDILTFKIRKRSPSNKRITSRVFFSVAKMRVIGTIDDQIVALFMNGNHVTAFHSSGSVYRITLHPSYKSQLDDKHFDEDRLLRENMCLKRKREAKFDGVEEDFERSRRKRRRAFIAEEIKKKVY